MKKIDKFNILPLTIYVWKEKDYGEYYLHVTDDVKKISSFADYVGQYELNKAGMVTRTVEISLDDAKVDACNKLVELASHFKGRRLARSAMRTRPKS